MTKEEKAAAEARVLLNGQSILHLFYVSNADPDPDPRVCVACGRVSRRGHPRESEHRWTAVGKLWSGRSSRFARCCDVWGLDDPDWRAWTRTTTARQRRTWMRRAESQAIRRAKRPGGGKGGA